MRQKIWTLLKVVGSSIRYSIPIFVTSLMCGVMVMLYLANDYSDRIKRVNEAKEQFGNYHLKINYNDEYRDYLCDKGYIEKEFLSRELSCEIDGEAVTFINVSDEWLKETEYVLLDGRLPQNDYEVVVDKPYMYSLGYTNEEMEGAKIMVPDIVSGKKMKRTVTGLIGCNSNDAYENGEPHIFGEIIDENVDMFSSYLYVELEKPKDVYNLIDKIDNGNFSKDIKLNASVNSELISEMGEEGVGRIEKNRKNRLFYAVGGVVLFITIVTILHVINLYYYGIKDDINVFLIIGVNEFKICLFLSALFIFYVIIGVMLGGVGGVYLIKLFQNIYETEMFIPWIKCFGVYCIQVVTVGVVIVYKMFYQMRNIDCNGNYKNDNIILNVKNSLCKKRLFYKPNFGHFKIVLNNLLNSVGMKIVTIVIQLTVVVMICLVFATTKEQLEYPDDNYKYRYKISFHDDMFCDTKEESERVYSDLKSLCKKYGVKYYIEEKGTATAKFNKYTELTKEFNDDLCKDAMGRSLVNNTYSDDIELPICILGYTQDMLDELCEKNGIELKNNTDAIILSRTVNRDNTRSNPINVEKNKTIEWRPFTFENETTLEMIKIDLNVVGCVNELPVYPEHIGNYLTMVINSNLIEEYDRHVYFPENIYIENENEELIMKIAGLGRGMDSIRVTDQFDKVKDANNAYIKRIVGYMCVSIFSIIFAIFNSIIVTKMELTIRRENYCILTVLGISRVSMMFTQLMEVVLCDVIALGIGIYIARNIIKIFVQRNLLYSNSITNREIYVIALICIVLMISKVILIIKENIRDERKNVIC